MQLLTTLHMGPLVYVLGSFPPPGFCDLSPCPILKTSGNDMLLSFVAILPPITATRRAFEAGPAKPLRRIEDLEEKVSEKLLARQHFNMSSHQNIILQ